MTNRFALSFVSLATAALAGCAALPTDDQPDEIGEAALAAAPAKACTASSDCGPNKHCSTEDGVCDGCDDPATGCVCSGTCVKDEAITCGDAVCGMGKTCCTASCSACVPGGTAHQRPTNQLECIVWCQNQGTLGDQVCLDLCTTRFPD